MVKIKLTICRRDVSVCVTRISVSQPASSMEPISKRLKIIEEVSETLLFSSLSFQNKC